MNAPPTAAGLRERQLRALGVEPWRMRSRAADPAAAISAAASPAMRAPPVEAATVPRAIRRLALQPDPAELADPAINKMYQALTEAVAKAGLQPVRVCDVAGDPDAAVMVLGAAPLPEGVPLARILRAEPLTMLHGDRERKRALWERMRALGRAGND
jgi:hypothetical protein